MKQNVNHRMVADGVSPPTKSYKVKKYDSYGSSMDSVPIDCIELASSMGKQHDTPHMNHSFIKSSSSCSASASPSPSPSPSTTTSLLHSYFAAEANEFKDKQETRNDEVNALNEEDDTDLSFHKSIFEFSCSSITTTPSSTKLSYWQTCFHLISFMIGSGLLCLPLALVEIEWTGLLLLVLAGLVNMYTSKLLIQALDVVRWSSGKNVFFSDLGRECFGKFGAISTATLVYVSLIINCSGYLGLAASFIVGITDFQHYTVLLMLSICVWTHAFAKSLKSLAVFSALNVALCLWMEAVIVGDAMYPLKQLALEQSAFVYETPDLSNAPIYLKLAYSFSLLASGFVSHIIVPSFYNSMEDTRKCTSAVTKSQFGVLMLMYLPICGISYAVYGPNMEAPVVFNMRSTFVRNLTIVLYSTHLLLSYSITLFPVQGAFEAYLVQQERKSVKYRSNYEQMVPQLPGRLESVTDSAQNLTFWKKLVCRSVLILMTMLFSNWFLPSTLDVFAFMLIPSMLLSLVLPCLFYWKLCQEEAGCLDVLAIIFVLALAVSATACTLTIVI
uniref:Amino Acid/Auxin Permease (AAAP) Family putative n=1 Tax=Albugo laibachii Nc14 TaxID=890382 RepID=F0WX59_9STRA|nr:Amino Acid/Auxin Permease (AAAP) Family putative [Albugo laibachii Nc14]|eukprot:CCA26050.1 Amino Acid/Auxin Permease (AAAP) Family putative [Albugo laibachii Nc14]